MSTIEQIMKLCANNHALGVPALIGPTQWGKTRLWQDIAAFFGKKLLIINPQWYLPEDIGGLPVRNGFTLQWTQPGVLPVEYFDNQLDYIILVDELDKAREDTLSGLLTFFSEGRIRSTQIEPFAIGVAMNEPIAPIPDPIVARLLFLPFPPSEGVDWPRRQDLDLVRNMLGCLPLPVVALPAIPPSPAAFHRIAAWCQVPEFWENMSIQETVVRGLFPLQMVPAISSHLKEQPFADPVLWARTVPTERMAADFIRMLEAVKDTTPFWAALWERAEKEPAGEIRRILEFINSRTDIAWHIGQGEASVATATQLFLSGLERYVMPEKSVASPTDEAP